MKILNTSHDFNFIKTLFQFFKAYKGFIFSGFLLLFLGTCKNKPSKELSSPQIQNQEKSEAALNFTVSRTGDTIRNGIPIPIKGRRIESKDLKNPKKYFVEKEPASSLLHPNSLKGKTPENFNLTEKPSTYTIGENDVPEPKAIDATGKVSPALNPKTNKALLPSYKDLSIEDIQYLTTEHGMQNEGVLCTFQDSKGLIWMGTSKGVIQYDGVQFRNYTSVEGFVDASISSIMEDQKGQIWFAATNKGIICYDGHNFIHYNQEGGFPNRYASVIKEDHAGRIWIGTSSGAVCYLPNQMKTSRGVDSIYTGDFYYFLEKEGFTNNPVVSIIEDSRHNIWFGSTFTNKVIRYIPKDLESILGNFTHIPYLQKEKQNFKVFTIFYNLNTGVFDLIDDKEGKIWLATGGAGVISFDPNKNWPDLTYQKYTEEHGLLSNQVIKIVEDKDGDKWFGTEVGLTHFSKEKNISRFTHFTRKEGLIKENITSIYEDKKGLLWIGTQNGIHRLDKNSFKSYKEKDRLESLSSLYEDSKKQIWIGTGFYFQNIKKIIQEDKDQMPNNVITGSEIMEYRGEDFWSDKLGINCFLEDNNGNYWIGTFSGLLHYVPPKGSTKGYYQYFNDEKVFNKLNTMVTNIFEDRLGHIWFSTFDGLIRYEPQPDGSVGDFTRFFDKSNWMSSLKVLLDSRGDIWTQSSNIVTRFTTPKLGENFDEGLFTIFSKNEGFQKRGTVLTEDQGGNIWFEVNGGSLMRYDYREDDSQNLRLVYYELEGAQSGKGILSMEIDQNQNFWISTTEGVEIFVPEVDDDSLKIGINEGKFKSIKYGKQDGVRILKQRAAFNLIDSENRLWMGTPDGLMMLDINDFELNTSSPLVRLNNIEIKEEAIDFRKIGDDSLYTSQFEYGETIANSFDSVAAFSNYPLGLNLPHYTDHIRFNFSGIDWGAPHKVRYSYMIEGINDSWSLPNTENYVDYRNLPFGNFTFKVRAIGETQEWSEPFEYKFTLRPPWWRTAIAYIAYFLLFLGLIYGIYLFIKRRLALQSQLKFEQNEAARLKELDTFKSTFYTNITHEFRTPLTVILGMIDQIKEKPDKYLEEGTTLIKRNGKNLLGQINQILDLSKLETNSTQLNMVQSDIVEFLRYSTEAFQSYANGQNLSLRFFSPVEKLQMDYDPDTIQNIMSNLISNAMKFTPDGGDVKVMLENSENQLTIKVQDTGVGISEKDLPHVFDRFYQVNDANGQNAYGTGVGLAYVRELVKILDGEISVKSEQEKGTTFIVNLPIKRTATIVENGTAKIETPIWKPIQNRVDVVGDSKIVKTIPATNGNLPQLLIIEDNADVVIYLKSCLSDLYNIEVAYNGKIGIEKALETIPDLIISDVMMPEKDGFEVCDVLKNDERTSHIPLILLTAKADSSSKITGLKRGADAYLSKPFDKEELLVRLELLAERQKKMATYFSKNNYAKEVLPAEVDIQEAIQVEDIFIKKVKNIIEENYSDENFALPQLCQKIRMSRSQLFRKMKALIGTSPSEFIRKYRLEKAKHLLETTEMNVSEVSWKVGFKDLSHFSKSFHAEFGYLPSATYN